MKSICTFIILNYKRPENVIKLYESIKKQNVKNSIVLIDNSSNGITLKADKIIRANWNAGCFIRLLYLPYVETEYVCFIDDDLIIKNDYSLSKWIDLYNTHNSPIIGSWGAQVNSEKLITNYISDTNLYNIIKGRHMLFRLDIIKNVNYNLIYSFKNTSRFEILKRIDDIFFSLSISNGDNILYASNEICNELIDVDSKHDKVGLCKDSNHKELRGKFAVEYFQLCKTLGF